MTASTNKARKIFHIATEGRTMRRSRRSLLLALVTALTAAVFLAAASPAKAWWDGSPTGNVTYVWGYYGASGSPTDWFGVIEGYASDRACVFCSAIDVSVRADVSLYDNFCYPRLGGVYVCKQYLAATYSVTQTTSPNSSGIPNAFKFSLSNLGHEQMTACVTAINVAGTSGGDTSLGCYSEFPRIYG
jgi:hypothetical protein